MKKYLLHSPMHNFFIIEAKDEFQAFDKLKNMTFEQWWKLVQNMPYNIAQNTYEYRLGYGYTLLNTLK